MAANSKEILENTFGHRLRVRACGMLVVDNQLLLLKHIGLGPLNYFWSVPGGGINFGESIESCLKREFYEETGLKITVGSFLFLNEYLNLPLHTIELFYKVTSKTPLSDISLGTDPELSANTQIITDLQFMDIDAFNAIPKEGRHRLNGSTDWTDFI